MLADDANLKKEFEEKKTTNEDFSQNPYSQLYWLYQRSVHFEPDYRLYPVMRVLN